MSDPHQQDDLHSARSTDSDWAERRLQLEALLKVPPDLRERQLTEIEAQDEDSAQELRELLDADNTETVIDQPIGRALADFAISALAVGRPDQVGEWELLDLIGQGGMGTVYRGRRSGDGYSQVAAIKLLEPRLLKGTRLEQARERSALAQLDHPNIARLIEAGSTPEGHFYIAMELVEGETIEQYSDREELSARNRISLFCDLCSAVDYAHRQLIVHGDIKPENILVHREGHIKLLDFGVASLLTAGDQDNSSSDPDDPHCGSEPLEVPPAEARFLTPEFASPEQLRGEALGTSTDVYSLGVVLWSLLAQVRAGNVPRQDDQRWLASAHQPTTGAGRRRARTLRGDLDAILARAVAPRVADRYPSPRELAADLERHLEHRPVSVNRPTVTGTLTRFVRREPAWSIAGFVFVLAVILSVTILLVSNSQIQAQTREAQIEAAKLRGTLVYLERFLNLAVADPANRPPEVASLLAEAEATLDQGASEEPGVTAELLRVLHELYLGQALFTQATRISERALSLAEKSLGEGPAEGRDDRTRDLSRASSRHAYSLIRAGRSEEAVHLLDQAIQLATEVDGPESLLVLQALRVQSYLTGRRTGRQTEQLRRRILELVRKRSDGPSSREIVQALDDHARAAYFVGDTRTAVAEYREALALAEQADISVSHRAHLHNNVAAVFNGLGDARAAESHARRAIEVYQGEEAQNPNLASPLSELAVALARQNKTDQALEAGARAVLLRRSMLAEQHATVAEALRTQGGLLCLANRTGEGLPAAGEALNLLKLSHSETDWRVGRAEATVALCRHWAAESGPAGARTSVSRAADISTALVAARAKIVASLSENTPIVRPIDRALRSGPGPPGPTPAGEALLP